jgi:hypothetical protein
MRDMLNKKVFLDVNIGLKKARFSLVFVWHPDQY